jgi:hypothetical protein
MASTPNSVNVISALRHTRQRIPAMPRIRWVELLETGRITFPLSSAAEVLAIKRGERPYAAVAEEIEWLLEAVEVAATRSTLREEPDQKFIDDLVARTYRASVLEAG